MNGKSFPVFRPPPSRSVCVCRLPAIFYSFPCLFSPLENQYPLKIHFFSRSRLDIDKSKTEPNFFHSRCICPWKHSFFFPHLHLHIFPWLWVLRNKSIAWEKEKSRGNFLSIQILPCGFENMTIDSEFHWISLYVSLFIFMF